MSIHYHSLVGKSIHDSGSLNKKQTFVKSTQKSKENLDN